MVIIEFWNIFAAKKEETMSPNQTVTRINLDVLKEKAEVEADYMDGDIVIYDGLKELPVEGALQMDMIIVVMCVEGRLQFDMNGKTHIVQANNMMVCPPNVYLTNYMISPNIDVKIIGLSYSALQRMLYVSKDIWNMMLRLVENPVFPLDEQHLQLMNYYYALLLFKLKQGGWAFYKDVMHALFQAIFYEICSVISTSLPAQEYAELKNMRQGDLLVNHFLKLLADSQGRERSVTSFAQRLHVSPKYLSTVCKLTTGKTALEWIHEYTIEVIVQRLQYTDKSIKEIAGELNFPNLSFFGKFVKARLGVSPVTYREQFARKSSISNCQQ